MQFINYSKSKLPFYVALSFTFILASCGSYQYVGYDNDGIYGTEDIATEQAVTSNNTNYYKNYFAEKSQQLNIPEEDIIFTDIDSYQGNYNENEDPNAINSYSGWGDTNADVFVNYYPSLGFSNWWYSPFYWNWYTPYWDWYTPYWGWGWGFNNYPYYGYPYYGYPYYGGHHYYNGYRNVAYNSGRRGTTSYYNTGRTSNYTAINSTSSLNRRSSVRSNTNNNVSNSRSFLSTTRRSQTTSLRPGATRQRATINGQNNTTNYRPRTTSASRPNTMTRNYSSTPRRSYNNSSSTVRSSGNSSPSISRSSGSSSRSNFSSSPRPSSGGSSGARPSSSGRRGNQ